MQLVITRFSRLTYGFLFHTSFRLKNKEKMNDALLQANLKKMQGKFVANRRAFKERSETGLNDARQIEEFADLCGDEHRLRALFVFIPLAALAGVLAVVAWNMAEAKHFVHVVRVSPKSDVIVLLACFSLTVVFDMVVAVTVGEDIERLKEFASLLREVNLGGTAIGTGLNAPKGFDKMVAERKAKAAKKPVP